MGYLTGGPIEHLKKGWAVFPFVGSKAHYWVEDKETMLPTINKGRVRYYQAKCGVTATTNAQVPALERGNWPKCKRCGR